MKKAAILFSLAASLVLAVGAGGQVNNTFYVKSFQGADVGTMVSAAMVQCNPDTTVKCFLVIDPSLVDYAAGTLPSMCSQCFLIDYRYGLPWGGGSGLPTGCSGSTGTIDCTGLIEGGTLESSSLTNTNTGVVIVSQTLGSGYLTASYSLSGGTCPTPPTLGQLVAAGLVINVITNPGSCSVLPSVIISGSGGTGATVTLGFAPNVATLSAAGLLQSDQMTGMGSVVMANGPALSHPLLNAPIVNFMTGQTYSELTSECSGGISPWMLNSWNSNGITESVSLAVCGSSAVNAIGFRASQFSGWQNFDSVHIGNNAQDGSADTSTLQVNFFNTFVPGQNSLSFHPCYSSTACLPQTSGLNWWVSNAGGALGIPVSSVGGGTGYTAAGTCALSGGALSSGSADGCTVSLSSGALIAAITGTGVYTVPPVLTLSGASGGSGANLTGTLVIQNPASATANLRVDPAGTLHYGPGSVQSPLADGLTVTAGGTLTVSSCNGCGLTKLFPTVTLGSTTASVSFTSIPSGYQNLRLVVTGTSTFSALDGIAIQLNGDTGAHYESSQTSSDGTQNIPPQSVWYLGHVTQAGLSPPHGTSIIVDFIDYVDPASCKSATAENNSYYSGGPFIIADFFSGNWCPATQAAITSINIALTPANGGSWSAGSTFTLYAY